MTASTNTILIKTHEGDYDEIAGVLYAEEAAHDDTGDQGVVVQYKRQPDEKDTKTDFITGVELVGVYDDIAEDTVTTEYKRHVNQ